MSDLQAATNGSEQRLDVLIARLDRVIELLAPSSPPEPSPEDGDAIELREPEADPKPKRKR